MKIFFQALLSIILLLPMSFVHATSADDLAKLLDATQSVRANFTQIIYDNRGKPVQKSIGSMALQRPGKFRWDIKRPIPQLIIANGERLWIYDPDLQQVTIRSLKNATGETPALLLSHVDNNLNQDFVIKELANKSPGMRWFSLTPKKNDNMFGAVEMGFKNTQLIEMHLKDNLGHTTKIRFSDLNTQAKLSASLFTFNPPKNVDVIDETRKKK